MSSSVLRFALSFLLCFAASPSLAAWPTRPPFAAAARTAPEVYFSPDAKSFATIRSNQTVSHGNVSVPEVVLWNATTGKIRCRIVLPHHNDPDRVVFSPDGRMMAVVVSSEFESEIELYDSQTDKLMRALAVDWITHYSQATGLGDIISAHFSQDGKTLAVATYLEQEAGDNPPPDNTHRVAFMSVATGKITRVLGSEWSGCYAAAFSPDGKTLATLDDARRGRVVTLRDARSGRRRNILPLGGEAASGLDTSSLQFSWNGRLLLVTDDAVSTISVWDVKRQTRLWKRPSKVTVPAAALSPDGQIVAFSPPGSDDAPNQKSSQFFVRLCRSTTGRVLRDLPAGYDDVRSLDYSPDGQWLTANVEGPRLRYWWMDTNCSHAGLSLTKK